MDPFLKVKNTKKNLRNKASSFNIIVDTLFKKSAERPYLTYLEDNAAKIILREIH